MNLSAYLRLARFHKPVGILLLWWPTAWALWLAYKGMPPLKELFLFFCGTVFMRAAGCIVNDLADKNIDIHVWRTKQRPLASGEISILEALSVLSVFLILALTVVLFLPRACFYLALPALALSFIYPFCKRYLQCPQLVLGLAFSMGIPMAFAAAKDLNNTLMYGLFLLNFFWILAYDTEYALADKEDDLKIGVKSSAILFGSQVHLIIGLFQVFFHLLWLSLAWASDCSWPFYLIWFFASLVLLYQQKLLRQKNLKLFLQAFNSNNYYGLALWLALILGL